MTYVIRRDGKYLYQRETNTHTGTNIWDDWVSDINQATVFNAPLRGRYPVEGERCEVTETRVVTLKTDSKMKEVQDIALACGFTLREQPNGEMDLNPYVYSFARILIQRTALECNQTWISPASPPGPPHGGCSGV